MDFLKDFEIKDFIDQITILKDIESRKLHEAIPELFRFCEIGDPGNQVQFMAENTLRTLLAENETQTLNGIKSDSINLQRICTQISGQCRYEAAVPLLMALLSESASDKQEKGIFFEIFSALSEIQSPDSLDIFRRHILHKDPLVAELAVEAIGNYGDQDSVDQLCDLVTEAEHDDRYEVCEVITASAIETLGRLGNDAAIQFLVSKIHHRNPTARQFVHKELVRAGEKAVMFLSSAFDQSDVDEKIMAAGILGLIGSRKAGDILVSAIDKGLIEDVNVRFAVYEALGKITSMKSLICLMDGLLERDDFLIIAVVYGLNSQVSPGVVEKLKDIIQTGDDQSRRLIRAIVAARADAIFAALYTDEGIADQLMITLTTSNDEETVQVFLEKLKSIDMARTKADIETLAGRCSKKTSMKVLAVDDSTAILRFYQLIASEMGIHVTTAENGQAALDCLRKGEQFDLILTDMNMPVMDGIEMTRKIRKNNKLENIPIMMATTESERSQSELAKKAGVNDFIKKPFTPDQLKDRINNFLK